MNMELSGTGDKAMALDEYYKDKVAPLHVMKVYSSGGTAPLILNLGIMYSSAIKRSGKNQGTYWIGGLVELRAALGFSKRNISCASHDSNPGPSST